MDKMIEECCICGGQDFKLIFRETKKISGGTYVFNNVICMYCGLIFINPRVGIFHHADYYKHKGIFHLEGEKGRFHKINLNRIEFINKYKNRFKKHTLLDVGCSSGEFLTIANQFGWEVEGIEVTDFYNSSLQRKGFVVYNQPLKFLPKHKRYSLIAYCAVLEHLENPIEEMQSACDHLTEDGLLFIEVPNAEFPTDYFYTPEHIFNYTIPSMDNLLAKVGMEIKEVNENTRGKYVLQVLAKKSSRKRPVSKISAQYLESLIKSSEKNSADQNQMKEKIICRLETIFEKNKGKSIFLYGAGQHANDLLGLHPRTLDRIEGFFDSDPKSIDKTLFGKPIYHKTNLREISPDVIIISSFAFEDEIYNNLKEIYDIDKVFKLYEN
ncbi:class I SAM-dependent methyltransferase [Desulfospira joergensenii]|uniref:class I SAM-dependent methyltransferase n=1 Tax=Desulfospira joergensenii TaxID=53329 RepID=UPI0003B7A4A0|nr:class I SAM-dependent methyltransferase [Desulfospira joergensenii]